LIIKRRGVKAEDDLIYGIAVDICQLNFSGSRSSGTHILLKLQGETIDGPQFTFLAKP